MAENKGKAHAGKRKAVQSLWGVMSNAYLPGFLKGKIYTGPLKRFCVPGMNCYSCPGALGACPIGSMQAVLDSRDRKFAFYVTGYLAMLGLLAGRFICGWLCLFGLIQELLYKVPVPKLRIPEKADRVLRHLKYVMLLVMVFGLPFFFRNRYGMGYPFFCKFICPVGTLEGGVPLVLLSEGLRSAVGLLFAWKFGILIFCLTGCMFVYRPFCKYVCPLGAFYALFQRVSLIRMEYDEKACVHCGACRKTCRMNVDPVKTPNSAECIRCGDCTRVCPKNALRFRHLPGRQKTGRQETAERL